MSRVFSPSSDSHSHSLLFSSLQVGLLTSVVNELETILNGDGRNCILDSEIETRLEIELHSAKEALDRSDKELSEKNEELKARAELLIDLTGKVRRF